MKIWVFSDTHNHHKDLVIPFGIDMIICCGDVANIKDPVLNKLEILDFLDWYKNIDVKYKLLIFGNHDTSFYYGLITRDDIDKSIIYLENESILIEGINFYGSPITPSFGRNWAFNSTKEDIHKYWDIIPGSTDILITHGPPKTVLDLSKYDSRPGAKGKLLFQCGCETLLEKVKEIKPRYHIFGHIHPEPACSNSGILQLQGNDTIFVNCSVYEYLGKENGVIIKKINNGFVLNT